MILSVLNFVWISFIHQGGSVKLLFKHTLPEEMSLDESDYLMKFIGKTHPTQIDFICPLSGIKIPESDSLRKKLRKNLHISEKLAYYSFDFLKKPLLIYHRSNNEEIAQRIINEVKILMDYINSFSLIPDRMKYNDHVISSRSEALILMRYVFSGNEIFNSQLKAITDKELLKCVINLSDDKRFTYHTNHGLMQVRALFSFASVFPTSSLAKLLAEKANERIEQLIDFHIAQDGSVFEGSSAYWFFIVSQFEIISESPILHESTKKKIESRLKKSRIFLSNITNSDGFVQGIGDSYSNNVGIIQNGNKDCGVLFKYQNGIAGYKQKDNFGNVFSLLFVSSDNPPNVHKHPEDLAIYVYINQPLFINPGPYGYDNSVARRYVLDQEIQNTVYDLSDGLPISSAIKYINYDPDQELIELYGEKKYKKTTITRKVDILLSNNIIKIVDSISNSGISNDENLLHTAFNVHPDLALKSDNEGIYLLRASDTLSAISSDSKSLIDTVYISMEMYSLSNVKRIIFSGKKNEALILLPPGLSFQNTVKIITIDKETDVVNQRQIIYEKLSTKYYWSKVFSKQSIKRLLYGRVLFTTMVLLSLLIFQRYGRIIFYVSCIVYLIDFICSGTVLSLSFIL
jgi:uncharacterized protein YggL (DUF469 family)